ncbi:hypothetical protein K443DRAFT_154230 [Laccaria amethystina LaAM-08-1]|uniref:CsbD-like domain-containing protein n=1 Tax=Laccaria amethystina LaAM-08-1 TaxID=1095629 RepID=A0A0C9X4L6_9AGAR|nr:hypothetical protein K443DRAFT_154230 [Laccaria amethystina LaAM-08-1]
MTGEPNKLNAQAQSAKGTAEQTIGDLTGSTSWKNAGQEDHAKGQAEYKGAQAKGYAEGTLDRLSGAKDSILGTITGNKGQEVSGDAQNEKGKVQQDLNKPT